MLSPAPGPGSSASRPCREHAEPSELAGAVGSRKLELPSEIQAELDARWTEEITPQLGFASYDELLAELRRR